MQATLQQPVVEKMKRKKVFNARLKSIAFIIVHKQPLIT